MTKKCEEIKKILEADPEVEITCQDVTKNYKSGDEYERFIYRDKLTGVWTTIEIPIELKK